MKANGGRGGRWITIAAVTGALAGPAQAQLAGEPVNLDEFRQQLEQETSRLNALQRSLEAQESQLNADRRLLQEQRQRIDALYQRMTGRGPAWNSAGWP